MIHFERKTLLRDTLLFGLSLTLLIAATFFASFGGDMWFSHAANTALAGTVTLNIAMLAYVFTDIRRRISLLLFQGPFNLLLFGRVYVSWIRDYENRLQLLEGKTFESIYWSIEVLAISLAVVYLAYRAGGFLLRRRETSLATEGARRILDNPIIPIVRQLSRWALYVSSLASFFSLGNTILFVLRNGYLTSFTETAGVPSIISRFSLFFYADICRFSGHHAVSQAAPPAYVRVWRVSSRLAVHRPPQHHCDKPVDAGVVCYSAR